jgi:hypothetical protein
LSSVNLRVILNVQTSSKKLSSLNLKLWFKKSKKVHPKNCEVWT